MNKTSMEKIKEFDEKKKIIDEEFRAIHEKGMKLMDERQALVYTAMKEEGMLKDVPWKLSVSIRRDNKSVQYSLKSDWDKHKRASELLGAEYHCNYEIEPGVTLWFSDGDMDLTFNTFELCINFVAAYEIKVDSTEMINEIKETEEKLKKYKTVVNKLKEIVK